MFAHIKDTLTGRITIINSNVQEQVLTTAENMMIIVVQH